MEFPAIIAILACNIQSTCGHEKSSHFAIGYKSLRLRTAQGVFIHRRESLLGASTASSGCDLQSRPEAFFLVAAPWRNRRSCSCFGKPSPAETCRGEPNKNDGDANMHTCINDCDARIEIQTPTLSHTHTHTHPFTHEARCECRGPGALLAGTPRPLTTLLAVSPLPSRPCCDVAPDFCWPRCDVGRTPPV